MGAIELEDIGGAVACIPGASVESVDRAVGCRGRPVADCAVVLDLLGAGALEDIVPASLDTRVLAVEKVLHGLRERMAQREIDHLRDLQKVAVLRVELRVELRGAREHEWAVIPAREGGGAGAGAGHV